jgi:hypothetical protein
VNMSKIRLSLIAGALALLLTACASPGPLVLSLADTQSGSGRNRADQFADASLLKLPDNVNYTLDATLPEFPSEMLSWSLTPTKESRAALKRIALALNIPGEVVKHERNLFSIGVPENSNAGLWLWVDIGGGWWSYFSGLNSVGEENLMSAEDAIARTKNILAKAELPTMNYEFTALKKARTTDVTGTLKMDGLRTNIAVRFTFGNDGAVLQASGPLLDHIKALVYPVISAQDAVARLTKEKYASVRTSDVVFSFASQNNSTISITGGELTLMQIVLNNRSSMLLPSYTFTNERGVVGTVLALPDQYLSYGDSIVTGGVAPEPAPVPKPVGTTTTTKPAIIDPDPSVLSKETANALVGLSEAEATKVATRNKWLVRVAKRDGEEFMLTMDYVTNRVNFTVDAGVVTSVSIG